MSRNTDEDVRERENSREWPTGCRECQRKVIEISFLPDGERVTDIQFALVPLATKGDHFLKLVTRPSSNSSPSSMPAIRKRFMHCEQRFLRRDATWNYDATDLSNKEGSWFFNYEGSFRILGYGATGWLSLRK